MGWKGTVRSLGAAARAAERDAKRRQKAREREHREMMRQHELAHAADAVAAYDDFIEALTTVHAHASGDVVDWEAISQARVPPLAPRSSRNEDAALQALADYEPGFFDKLLSRSEKRQSDLELAVRTARQQDDAEYETATRAHATAVAVAEEEAALGRRVLAGDLDAFSEAVTALHPFDEIGDLGSSVAFNFEKPDEDSALESVLVRATVRVHGKDIIPKERLSLLASGKLSRKSMPVSQYHAVHQDYVCGCVLRVASETLAILPVAGVVVTATDEMLDTSTGHIEETPVVSVWAPRRTMARLNLAAADPSDALSNFLHRVSFLKTKGFRPVQELSREDVPDLSATDPS